MSYNIDTVEATVLNAWMKARDVVTLYTKLEGELCEGNFLEQMIDAAKAAVASNEYDKTIPLPNVWWYGEGSGRTFKDVFVNKIAHKIHGEVVAICIWEGGDSFSGFVIEDGVYEECDVEMKVIRKPKAAKKAPKISAKK